MLRANTILNIPKIEFICEPEELFPIVQTILEETDKVLNEDPDLPFALAVGHDTETTGLHIKLDRVSLFSFYAPVKYRIPRLELNNERAAFTVLGPLCNRSENFEVFRPVLEHPRIVKCGANYSGFDWFMMHNHGVDVVDPIHDVVVMDWLHNENYSGQHGLKPQARRYFNYPMRDYITAGGGLQDIRDWPFKAAKDYPAIDGYISYATWDFLSEQLSRFRMYHSGLTAWEFYCEFLVPVQKVLRNMMARGIRIDLDYLDSLAPKILAEASQIERQLNTEWTRLQVEQEKEYITEAEERTDLSRIERGLVPKRLGQGSRLFNLKSTPQLRFFFFELLEQKVIKMTKPGKQSGMQNPSLDKEVLAEYSDQGCEFASELLRYRELSKLYGTYIGDIPDDEESASRRAEQGGLRSKVLNGRVHTHFKFGPVTGRLASSGPNLMNIPIRTQLGKQIREAFIPAPGYKLIGADYCVSADTRVVTDAGCLQIRDVSPGLLVYTSNGRRSPIKDVIHKGPQETFTLRTRMGYKITSTKLHRFKVWKDHKLCWMTLGEIERSVNKDSVYVLMRSGGVSSRHVIELPLVEYAHHNNKKIKAPSILSDDLCVFLGYLVGDGSITPAGKGIRWVVNAVDQDLCSLLLEKSIALFDKAPAVRKHRGVEDYQIHSVPLKNWALRAGYSKEKVPEWLWQAGEIQISLFLRGLFEADGCASGRVSFSTINEQLARDVQYLLLLIGVGSTVRKTTHGKGVGYIWLVSVPSRWLAAFQEKVGFLSRRKKKKAHELASKATAKKLGSVPLSKELVRAAGLKGETYTLMRNFMQRESCVSPRTIQKLKELDPQAYRQLGLDVFDSPALFVDEVVAITPNGHEVVYDLHVPDGNEYIAAGMASHNSQVEMRLFASAAEEWAMIQAIKDGRDMHCHSASLMYHLPYAAVLEAKQKSDAGLELLDDELDYLTKRQAAKTLGFGLTVTPTFTILFSKEDSYANRTYVC